MEFINQAVTVLQTLVVALGAGLAVWGVVNLMEGPVAAWYSSARPSSPCCPVCSDNRFAYPHGRARNAALSLHF